MAIRATISRFPVDPDVQESSGLPWGLTLTPFSQTDEIGSSPVVGSDGHLLPRCENCWGYFNTYCELEQWAWTCALCGALNGLSSRDIDRYSQTQNPCAEMISSFVDLDLPGLDLVIHTTSSCHGITDDGFGLYFFPFDSVEGYAEEGMQARPVYVAAVDLSCKIRNFSSFLVCFIENFMNA